MAMVVTPTLPRVMWKINEPVLAFHTYVKRCHVTNKKLYSGVKP